MNMRGKLAFCLILLLISVDGHCKKKPHINRHIDVTPNQNNNNILTGATEFDLFGTSEYTNLMVDYSAMNNFDYQITITNIPLSDGATQQNYNYDSYFNLSYTQQFDDAKIIFGTQNGTTLATNTSWHNFDYILSQYDYKDSNIHIGGYYANSGMSTTTDLFDFTAGFVYSFKRVSLQTDYYDGQNNLGSTNVTLQYTITKNVQLYHGISIPNENSGNYLYGYVGVSLVFVK